MFGERLADLRKDKNLKQKDLAIILNVSIDMMSAYERGITQMPDDIKIKVAKYFNISLDYLCGLINQEISYNRDVALSFPSCFDNGTIEKAKHYLSLLELEIKSRELS